MYEKSPTHGQSTSGLPPILSSLAIVSLIFALISPVVLCVFGLSLLTSLIAIITGVAALVRIGNSRGELSGRGAAIAGLMIGNLMFGVSIVIIVMLVPTIQKYYLKNRQQRARAQAVAPSSPARFRQSESPARGPITVLDNVPVSREVVQRYSDLGWAVNSLAFSPAGDRLVAGKMDRKLLVLDVHTGATLCTLEDLNHLSAVDQVAFSSDGQVVIAAGSSGAVSSWMIDSAGMLSDARTLTPHKQSVECLAVGPAATILMTGSADGELIWQTYHRSDEKAKTHRALPRRALAAHLPKEGHKALATDGSTLIEIDLKTAEVTATREFPRSAAQSAAFSRDGTKLAVTAGYEIRIYDTATGASLGTFTAGHEMQWTVAFLPDDQRFISGGRGFATLWNLEADAAECRFDLGGVLYIQTLAISPDGTLLAAIPAAAGQTITVLKIP